jgi:glycine/D-amino acid oxidase-like deaminating enzyme
MARRIVVVGAGIVGTAVAERLGARGGCQVTVLDQASRGRLPGSTGHAPGFVGVLGDDVALNELARESVAVYRKLEWRGQAGYECVGGLELAQSLAGLKTLVSRAQAATTAGIPATLLDPADAVRLAPRLVDRVGVEAALHLPLDGVARAQVITAGLGARAAAAGVCFVPDAKVTGIELRGGRVAAVRAGRDVFAADDVVIACGIWGPEVARLAGEELPLVPVAHPYVFSARRPRAYPPSPLVRWPQSRVYARDHGDRDGLGTSNHDPIVVGELAGQAERPWPGGSFDDAVTAAIQLLPAQHRWQPAQRLNGVLSITPDKRPLLGSFGQSGGLWLAEAIWVTHAAGAASALTAQMFGELAGIGPLDPGRFANQPLEQLRRRAVARYRNTSPDCSPAAALTQEDG